MPGPEPLLTAIFGLVLNCYLQGTASLINSLTLAVQKRNSVVATLEALDSWELGAVEKIFWAIVFIFFIVFYIL